MSEENTIPSIITAIRSISYDVDSIVESMKEDKPNDYKPTYDEVIEIIERMVKDDLSCGWGHEVNLKDIVLMDDSGNEI